VCVALLGPDGTGKTTLAQGLAEIAWPMRVRSVYMGFPVRRDVRARVARLPGLAIPLTWLRYARAARYRHSGELVIFDRYPYDYLVRSNVSGLRRAHRWALARACPAPDLVIVLDAPPETVAARAGTVDFDEVAQARHYYLALAERLSNAVVIDASCDRTAVRDDVAAVIRQHAKVELT
jgi:thymidylate kinase